MEVVPVYPVFDIEPQKAEGCYLWDNHDKRYLDFYGGHAVISIGHSHPHYQEKLKAQISQIGFYSNSIRIPLQDALAHKLGELSGYPDYSLFLCNSGAEAVENALKLASFGNQRNKVIAFHHGFHGRTSLAVAVTDNPRIQAPVNFHPEVILHDLNDLAGVESTVKGEDVCAIIIEGIQGIGGIHIPDDKFLQDLRSLCDQHQTMLILDEIQSGYGRSGKFFAHQYADIQPDLITMAKGMGNGFPLGGVLIHPRFEAWPGMLGTTFGGNHLACAAGLAVLEVLEKENLMQNAGEMGQYLMDNLAGLPQIEELRGRGLMIGIEMSEPVNPLREKLLFEHSIFTGSAANKNVLRLLPPLCLKKTEADYFLQAFKTAVEG